MADELARCLLDARTCADACEAFLEELRAVDDAGLRRTVLDALVAPAAVARVLIDLIDHPPQLVLAAVRLCRESARHGVEQLETLSGLDSTHVARALEAAADSCTLLLEAASL